MVQLEIIKLAPRLVYESRRVYESARDGLVSWKLLAPLSVDITHNRAFIVGMPQAIFDISTPHRVLNSPISLCSRPELWT